jgi:hypothetical protein
VLVCAACEARRAVRLNPAGGTNLRRLSCAACSVWAAVVGGFLPDQLANIERTRRNGWNVVKGLEGWSETADVLLE